MAQRKKSAPPRTYHHGQLREALIAAAEAILAQQGLAALSLRAAARRAGVSPAAPTHHFASLKGLLTAVATLGFEALAEELVAGNARGGDDPAARLCEQGVGYVRFAQRHPGRFLLMFRREQLDHEDTRLKTAARDAFRLLEEAVREVRRLPAERALDGQALALLLLAWSTVHGFAHLTLEGQFDALAGSAGPAAFVTARLPDVLAAMLRAA